MKKIILVFIVACLFSLCQAQLLETFYTVNATDGRIRFTDKYYEPDLYPYKDITPYDFVSKIEYASQGNRYAVELLNYKDWAEMEPGFARVCYLYCNGRKIFEVIDDMGWCKVADYSSRASIRTDDCLIFCQKNDVDVIILQGYPYESQPRIVVIAVQGKQAKIVSFTNQKFHIESVSRDSDGYFEIKLKNSWPQLGPNGYTVPKGYTMKSTATGMYLYKD